MATTTPNKERKTKKTKQKLGSFSGARKFE
jgi:hypothetical protein